MPKQKKNHPWKNGITPTIEKWAKDESHITNVQTVLSARSENLKRKDGSKIKRGAL